MPTAPHLGWIAAGAAACGLAALGIYQAKHRPTPLVSPDSPAYAEALQALGVQFPAPVGVSTTGQLLAKLKTESRFGLRVVDLASGQTRTEHWTEHAQLAPVWSPDGRTVAYLSSADGAAEFHLELWQVAANTVVVSDAPPAHSSALPVRWSPDGTKLAYAAGDAAGNHLVVVDAASGKALANAADAKTFTALSSETDFQWLPDSSAITWVDGLQSGNVGLFMVATHTELHLRTDPDLSLHQLACKDAGVCYAAARRHDSERYALYKLTCRIDSTTPAEPCQAMPLSVPVGDVVEVTGTRAPNLPYLYRVNDSSLTGGRIRVLTSGGLELSEDLDGDTVLAGTSDDGSIVYLIHIGLREPAEVWRVDVKNEQRQVVFRTAQPGATTLAAPDYVVLHASDGLAIPAAYWAAVGPPHGALVQIHGGPRAQAFPKWNPVTRYLVEHGIAVLSVNYRGSLNYGQTFEAQTNADKRVEDVIAGVRFARQATGLPPERLFLQGDSYGTALVRLASWRFPQEARALLLLAVAPLPKNFASAPERVLAFHGGHDPLSLTAAQADLAESVAFAPAAKPGHLWLALPAEGHSFQALSSWTSVYANLVQQLR